MKQFTMMAVLTAATLLITTTTTEAQPVAPRAMAAPTAMVPAPAKPAMAPAMALVVPMGTAEIIPMTAAMTAPAAFPMVASSMTSDTSAKTTDAKQPAAKKPTKDETASKWINLLGPGLIALVIFILGMVGAKKYLAHERAKSILTGVRDGVKSWYTYAQGTDQKWDDAVSKLLLDLSDRLIAEGQPPLTETEKHAVALAAEVNKKIIGPDTAEG